MPPEVPLAAPTFLFRISVYGSVFSVPSVISVISVVNCVCILRRFMPVVIGFHRAPAQRAIHAGFC
jgi:hypothetical protein